MRVVATSTPVRLKTFITSPEAPLTCTTLPLTEMVMPDVVISTLSCST